MPTHLTLIGIGVLAVLAAGAYALAGTHTPTPTDKAAVQGAVAAVATENDTVPSADFASLLKTGEYTLIDVRTPEEYAEGHLPGATLVNVRAEDFAARIAALPKDRAYALYCRSGGRSGQARERMARAGFTRVVDLSGGIHAWRADGREVTTAPATDPVQ